MANENNTNAPRPLTDADKARLAAALAASKGTVDQPKPGDIKPDEGTHKPVTPQVAAMPGVTPLGVKPAPDTSKPAAPVTTKPAEKPISELVKAATTALSNTDDKAGADAAVAALATATNLPVNPAKVASTDPATAKADHKAAIDKANANVGKGQGGTVTKAKGKGETKPAPVTVTPAKPKHLGKPPA